jgi:hypothetical protein
MPQVGLFPAPVGRIGGMKIEKPTPFRVAATVLAASVLIASIVAIATTPQVGYDLDSLGAWPTAALLSGLALPCIWIRSAFGC